MKKMHTGLTVAAALILLMQGCTGSGVIREDETPMDDSRAGMEGGTQTGTAVMGGSFAGRPIAEVLSDPNTPLYKRVFYFDYNSSELSVEDRQSLSTHARFMAEVQGVTLVLEGHADERGSREYNLALGERRAKTIERILSLEGVPAGRLQVISFGEERPMAPGHDDEAWRLNRRVELLYSGY